MAQGNRQALPRWHRRLWSVRRRGARRLRRVHRLAGCCRPDARLPRRSVPRWRVGRRGIGRRFGWPVRWLRELGVLPRRPVRPRPRTLPAPGSAPHVPAALRSRRSAGFVRRRDRRASVGEGTAVADTRSAAPRAPSALLARGSGRRGSGPWSSEVVFVIGPPGRSHTAVSRCPSDPAWGSLVQTLGPVGTG